MSPTPPSSPKCCSSSASGWPKTAAASAPPWNSSSATPPTACPNYAATSSGSSSCSAAATASNCSAPDQAFPWASPATPGHTGLNVVRPRARALRALHVDPPLFSLPHHVEVVLLDLRCPGHHLRYVVGYVDVAARKDVGRS